MISYCLLMMMILKVVAVDDEVVFPVFLEKYSKYFYTLGNLGDPSKVMRFKIDITNDYSLVRETKDYSIEKSKRSIYSDKTFIYKGKINGTEGIDLIELNQTKYYVFFFLYTKEKEDLPYGEPYSVLGLGRGTNSFTTQIFAEKIIQHRTLLFQNSLENSDTTELIIGRKLDSKNNNNYNRCKMEETNEKDFSCVLTKIYINETSSIDINTSAIFDTSLHHIIIPYRYNDGIIKKFLGSNEFYNMQYCHFVYDFIRVFIDCYKETLSSLPKELHFVFGEVHTILKREELFYKVDEKDENSLYRAKIELYFKAEDITIGTFFIKKFQIGFDEDNSSIYFNGGDVYNEKEGPKTKENRKAKVFKYNTLCLLVLVVGILFTGYVRNKIRKEISNIKTREKYYMISSF